MSQHDQTAVDHEAPPVLARDEGNAANQGLTEPVLSADSVAPIRVSESTSEPFYDPFSADEGFVLDSTDKPRRHYRELFCYATGADYARLVCGFILAFLTGLSSPIANYAFGTLTVAIIDLAGNRTNCKIGNSEMLSKFQNQVITFVILNMIAAAVSFIFGYLTVLCFNTVGENMAHQFRLKYFEACIRQEIGYFDTTAKRDFPHKIIEDITKIQEAVSEKLGFCITTVSGAAILIVQAYYFGWKLSLVLSLVIPFTALSTYYDARITTSLTAKEQALYGSAGAVAEEVLGNIRTVAAFNGQEKEAQRYEESLVKARKFTFKKAFLVGSGNGIGWLLTFLNYALGFWYGTFLVLESMELKNNEYRTDTLVIVFFGIQFACYNIAMSGQYFESFGVGIGSARGIFEVLKRQSEIDAMADHRGVNPEENLVGGIEFASVSFAYPSRPSVKVLKELSFKVRPGQTIALVGHSGCGKSTCIQLLQRFYYPASGEIKLDGQNIDELNVSWIRSQMGLVGQEPVLFNRSIKENISCGRNDISFEDVKAACRLAYAHEFISALPDQYNTRVGERGTHLSGGQKQRIAIARALVRNPAILLLDEATSALDFQSEAILQAALERARTGRTTIIVAHRLSTIQAADIILAMDKGQVAESGTHSELMEKKGLYYNLVTSQVHEGQDNSENLKEDKPSLEDIIALDARSSPASLQELPEIPSSDSLIGQSIANKKLMKTFQLKRLLKLTLNDWPALLCSTIATLIKSVNIPLYAIVFGDFLAIFKEHDTEYIRKRGDLYSGFYVAIAVGTGLSSFAQYFFITLAQDSLTFRLRKLVFRNLLDKDMSYFNEPENTPGKVCGRLSNDALSIQGASGYRFILFLQGVVTIAICVGLSIYFLPKMGAVVTLFFPLTVLSAFLEGKVLANDNVSEKISIEKASNIGVEALSNMRTVCSLGLERKFLEAYSKSLLRSHRINLRRAHIRGFVYAIVQAMPYIAHSLSLYYGAYLVETECADIADVFKVAEALLFGTTVGGAALGYAPDYDKARIAGARIFKLFDRTPLIDPSDSTGDRLVEPEGKFDLKDITFSYPNRTISVLNGVTITINPGDKVALVGPSGSGKSSLVSLLLRFYDPQTGIITLDDIGFKTLNLNYLRSQLALVSQEPILFDYSIADNIAYGDNSRKVEMDEIIEVARMSNSHDFITSLSAGYETRVGALGSQLSGGQKQRVCIARALIRHPKLLILDEATSALDTESEALVQAALDNVQNVRTSITIAHRLTSIQNSTQIIAMKDGEVVEQGTHEELVSASGLYKDMWFAQEQHGRGGSEDNPTS